MSFDSKLSFTKKKNGKGFEFYHYDAEKGRGNKRVTQCDFPQIKNIITEEQANDFKNWWNQNHEELQKELRAKRNHELKSKDFDFLGAVSGYHERQKEVMEDVDRAMRNKRSTTSIKKFSGVEPKKAITQYVKSWGFEQLRTFEDFAQKSGNPDWQYDSKIAYCAALMTLRRSGHLPLFKRNFRNDEQDRPCCFPEHTIQKQQGSKGGIVYQIGAPEDVKPLPKKIPMWEVRLERYVRELIAKTKLQVEGANDWLFPDPRRWSPDTNAAKMWAGEIFYHPERLSDAFVEIAAASGLPLILLKNLRHTGINIIRNIQSYTRRTDLARLIAGHKSESTTNRHYVDRDGSIEDTDFDDLWEARQVFAEKYGA